MYVSLDIIIIILEMNKRKLIFPLLSLNQTNQSLTVSTGEEVNRLRRRHSMLHVSYLDDITSVRATITVLGSREGL